MRIGDSDKRARWARRIAAALAVFAILGYILTAAPGPRSLWQFHPDRVADLDLRM